MLRASPKQQHAWEAAIQHRTSVETASCATTSSSVPLPASGHHNEILETTVSKANIASRDVSGAADTPLTVAESSVPALEYDVPDREDTLFELVTSTSEHGITSIKGLDFKDNVEVTLDLDQIPEAVCGLALQAVVNAAAKNEDFCWFSAEDACVRPASLGRRSKWHPTTHRFAACQTCTNTRNICLGIDKDDQGKLILRIRPLAREFWGGAALHDPESWILPVDNGKRTLTRHRAWRQGRL
ncbi:hypothetical protein KC367_g2132 [Hortaea werneckii]|nr:hypothetical protein KC367_g2132 [Hortaea werneckii]